MTDQPHSPHHSHAAHAHDEHAHDEHAHHGGLGKYLAVALALMILTAISFAVANSPIMDTPSVGWLVMMAVSVTKAMLVIMFFMHLIWEANWKYVLTIPCTIMSVLLVMALVPDVFMRYRTTTPQRLLHAAEVTPDESAIFEVTEGESELGAVPRPVPGEAAQPGDQYIETHDEPTGAPH
jgi:caa(3)-type oxidase subunit IV